MKRIWVMAALFLIFVGVAKAQTFQSIDTATGNAWQGKYGTNGYQIPLGVSSLGSTATVLFNGDSTWTWATGFTCWYSPTSFTISVNILDGKTHQVAFWLLDYDKQGRVETINGQTISAFQSSKYVIFTVSGNATFTITHGAGGPNAVVNGIFFDPSSSVTPPPVGTTHSVTITWTAPANAATTFNLYRNGVKLVSGLTVAQYVDTTLISGTAYSYSATTVNAGVESVQAPVSTITFTAP